MARADVKNGVLRGCPTCGTRVAKADIGLRDFSWVNPILPGKLGLMDLDGVLTQAATGRVLVMEMKPKGAYVPTGERLTFALFVKAGYDVWVVWDLEDGTVKLSPCNDKGYPYDPVVMTQDEAATLVLQWWDKGAGHE